MRALVGIMALLLALATGYLALTAGVPAFTAGGVSPMPPGQVRGIVFTVVMAGASVGLFWLALRSFGSGKPRSRPKD